MHPRSLPAAPLPPSAELLLLSPLHIPELLEPKSLPEAAALLSLHGRHRSSPLPSAAASSTGGQHPPSDRPPIHQLPSLLSPETVHFSTLRCPLHDSLRLKYLPNPGDVVHVPSNWWHATSNLSASPAVAFGGLGPSPGLALAVAESDLAKLGAAPGAELGAGLLRAACHLGRWEARDVLLGRGLDPEEPDAKGKSAVDYEREYRERCGVET
ncbi:hypothetical protein TeGR_g2390 [Tetraparma gracilis]|uniref:JmjC domain-containing protein n=1 Tax=Tetraparma gracilis TaxID=2962635 RepID=A0ABQ6N8S3_9STRA|nr:hypothetical protein TeGR_g2390 [Tetraparma gracilis]